MSTDLHTQQEVLLRSYNNDLLYPKLSYSEYLDMLDDEVRDDDFDYFDENDANNVAELKPSCSSSSLGLQSSLLSDRAQILGLYEPTKVDTRSKQGELINKGRTSDPPVAAVSCEVLSRVAHIVYDDDKDGPSENSVTGTITCQHQIPQVILVLDSDEEEESTIRSSIDHCIARDRPHSHLQQLSSSPTRTGRQRALVDRLGVVRWRVAGGLDPDNIAREQERLRSKRQALQAKKRKVNEDTAAIDRELGVMKEKIRRLEKH